MGEGNESHYRLRLFTTAKRLVYFVYHVLNILPVVLPTRSPSTTKTLLSLRAADEPSEMPAFFDKEDLLSVASENSYMKREENHEKSRKDVDAVA